MTLENTDAKFKQFIEELDKDFGLNKYPAYMIFIEKAFKAGREAQCEEDGEHRVTNIGQHL